MTTFATFPVAFINVGDGPTADKRGDMTMLVEAGALAICTAEFADRDDLGRAFCKATGWQGVNIGPESPIYLHPDVHLRHWHQVRVPIGELGPKGKGQDSVVAKVITVADVSYDGADFRIVNGHMVVSAFSTTGAEGDRRKAAWRKELRAYFAQIEGHTVTTMDANATIGHVEDLAPAGWSAAKTGPTIRNRRIDFIGHTKGIGVVSARTLETSGSRKINDHRALLADLRIPKAAKPAPTPPPPVKEVEVPDFSVHRYGTDTSGRAIWMTAYMHDWWQRVVDRLGFTPTIVQGAFMVRDGGGAKASAGYHDAGGCIDVRIWDLTASQQEALIHTVREMGAAAWRRDKTPAHGGMDPHCHITLGSDRPLSAGALASWSSYLKGRNGLASNGPDYEWRPKPLVTTPPPPEEDDMQLTDELYPGKKDKDVRVIDVLRSLDKFIDRQDARQKEALSRLDPDQLADAVADRLVPKVSGASGGLTADQVKQAVKDVLREGVGK